ncbi:hypothetical protein [Ruicaihuangia caeni]|uniref:Uncharacterized protein n=1 Tax=Ruicaihuangia caeni TaxID=3042517 RepID=A0AAW6T0S1_9MICO|nr:hypothetical protein [Klugiella sp. YN-L-19]MDI2097402.1 hypothetical protein [Klugiella sp. YN-L-19]
MTVEAASAEQLKLVHLYGLRIADELLAKQSNMINRASLVLAAAALLALVQPASIVNGWSWIPIALAVITALCALRAVALWKSKTVDVTLVPLDTLLSFAAVTLEAALVRDLFKQIEALKGDLARKAFWTKAAIALLIVTMISSALISGFAALKWI